MTTIGTILKISRITNDLRVSEVSKIIKISPSYICDIERGRRNPSLRTLEKLSNVYKIPVSEFYRVKEKADEEKWDYKKVFYEIIKSYFKHNPEEESQA